MSSPSPLPDIKHAPELSGAPLPENKAEITATKTNKSSGRLWSVVTFLPKHGMNICHTLSDYVFLPLASLANKITNFIFDIFTDADDDELDRALKESEQKFREAQPAIHASPKPSQPLSQRTSLSFDAVEIEEMVKPVFKLNEKKELALPPMIKMPALGNCFYCAAFVWFKIMCAEDQAILKKLGNNKIDPRRLRVPDLSTRNYQILLQNPVANLRKIVTDSISRKLARLEKSVKFMTWLQEVDNDFSQYEPLTANSTPKERRNFQLKLELSAMIQSLKRSIDDHNQHVEAKLQQAQQAYSLNHTRYVEARQELDQVLLNLEEFNSSLDSATKKELAAKIPVLTSVITNAAPAIARNLQEIHTCTHQKIDCSPNGFKISELPELKRYVTEFMKKDMNYASDADILTLANIFQVSIEIRAICDDDFQTKTITPLRCPSYRESYEKTIVLQLKNGHYDLITNPDNWP